MNTASELGMKMGKLNSSMIEETDKMKTKRIYSKDIDLSAINTAKGNQNALQFVVQLALTSAG